MTTRVPGSSARISRQASIPEPSGRRTSMTTRSGWYLRAPSSASSTVPASATTWNRSRRSSSATRPWRTTSWSSTTSRRRGRDSGCSVISCSYPPVLPARPRIAGMRLRRRPGRPRPVLVGPAPGTRTMIRVPAPGWLSTTSVAPIEIGPRSACCAGPGGPRPRGAAGSKPTPLSAMTISSPAIAGSGSTDQLGARRPGVAGDVAERLAGDGEQLGGPVGADVRRRDRAGRRAARRRSSC